VIAWTERIRREAPFLASVFGDVDSRGLPRRLLDVGCGSGEHAKHFAELGWMAVGVDLSESMIESATEIAGETPTGGSVRFEQRDAATSGELPEVPFGGAIFLGNGTAFLTTREELDASLSGVAAALAPGAALLIQTLNYERIEREPVRSLPVNVRPLPEEEGGGEIVWVRILSPSPESGIVEMFPITLELRRSDDPDETPPEVAIRGVKQIRHRAWKRPDFEDALAAAGFEAVEFRGGMREEPFEPLSSHDLVVLARRRG
jgi:SAM-dependent methyltransferase